MNKLSVTREDITSHIENSYTKLNNKVKSSCLYEELMLPLVKMLHSIYIADMTLEAS